MNSDFFCVHHDGVYAYRRETGNFKKVLFNSSVATGFYGLTWDDQGTLFVTNDRVVRIIDVENKKLGPVKIDNCRGAHQIVWYDDVLYVADTGHNCIRSFSDSRGKSVVPVDAQPEETKKSHGPGDRDHINSIFRHKGKFYLCCHNHDEPSLILICDKNFNILERVGNIGLQCHNVYVENDTLYALSSKTQAIVKYDLTSGKQEEYFFDSELGRPVFLRGLAKSKDRFFFGVTVATIAEKRNDGPNWIVEMDNDLNMTDVILAPSTTDIREIRLIGEVDFAHNEVVYEF